MAVVAFKKSSVRINGRRPSPYSKPHVLARLDGNCQVAVYIRTFAKELDDQLGGSTTPAQKALIKEAAIKSAKLGLLVDKILANTEPDPDLASRCYLAGVIHCVVILKCWALAGPRSRRRGSRSIWRGVRRREARRRDGPARGLADPNLFTPGSRTRRRGGPGSRSCGRCSPCRWTPRISRPSPAALAGRLRRPSMRTRPGWSRAGGAARASFWR